MDTGQNKSLQIKIAEILRQTGRKECLIKAESLKNTKTNKSQLNLRLLSLTTKEAEQLALVFKGLDAHCRSKLESISFSYNHLLKDKGTITLIRDLPNSIKELGFVNCGMGDIGGQALLNWIKDAPNLSMICAEQNLFSDKLKSDFQEFGNQHPHIMVVV